MPRPYLQAAADLAAHLRANYLRIGVPPDRLRRPNRHDFALLVGLACQLKTALEPPQTPLDPTAPGRMVLKGEEVRYVTQLWEDLAGLLECLGLPPDAPVAEWTGRFCLDVRIPEEIANGLEWAVEGLRRLDGTAEGQIATMGSPPAKASTKWVQAQTVMRELKKAGEKFTNEREIAVRAGAVLKSRVSQRTIQKALRNSPDLQDWRDDSKEETASLGAVSLSERILETVPVRSEASGFAEDEIEAGLREIVEAAPPEEKRREIAALRLGQLEDDKEYHIGKNLKHRVSRANRIAHRKV